MNEERGHAPERSYWEGTIEMLGELQQQFRTPLPSAFTYSTPGP